MTTRRTPIRRAVRHANPARELAAWKMTFTCGWDYFSDLDTIGLDRDRVTRRQIQDAWARLGVLFLAGWEGESDSTKGRRWPWALEQFGEPPP